MRHLAVHRGLQSSAVVLVALILAACNDSSNVTGVQSPSAADVPASARVQGVVRADGSGVAGVRVFLRAEPGEIRTTTSVSGGFYEFEAVVPGLIELTVEPPSGFELPGGASEGRIAVLSPSETVQVDFEIVRSSPGSD